MLVTIAIGLLFFSCTFLIGNWVGAVLAKTVNSPISCVDLFQNFILGFAFITTFLSIWSFFLPVNYYALVPVLIFCVITLKYSWHASQDLIVKLKSLFTMPVAITTVPVLLVVIVYALMPPLHGDSPGYHFHSIRWNESYKVIPGLANLHGRFGFNSSFFVTSAAFAFTKVAGQSIYVVNIVLVLSFYAWLLYKAFRYTNSVWLIIFLFAAIASFRELLYGTSSPTPDTIATIIAIYVFVTLAEDAFKTRKMDSLQAVILILLVCFALTIKLSTFPLLLAAFYVFVKKGIYKTRAFFIIIVSAVIIILPWLIRTYVLTGYILYPVKVSGFLKPDWQVPLEVLKFDKLLINNGPKMISEKWEEVDKLSFIQWFPLWIKAQITRGLFVNLALLAIAIASCALTLVVSIRKRNNHIFWLSIINTACILFWLFNSPDYRFGYPYLINSIILLLLFFTLNKPLNNYIKAIAGICVPAICAYYIYPAVEYLHKQSFEGIAVKPLQADIYKVKTDTGSFPSILLNERVKLYVEDANHNCNLVNLPCFPVYFEKLFPQQIELRGESIEDGFRIKQQ